jgi:fatty acid desaturase
MTIQRVAVDMQPEWLEPSDAYGWKAVLRNTLPLVALLSITPIVADWNVYAAWALVPVVGLLMYRITVVMHDCTHRTLFRSRNLNERVGSLLGALTGIDFQSFSSQHWQHHLSYGERHDPQGFHYVDLKRKKSGEFYWHVAKPLFGLNLRYTFSESLLAPKNLTRVISTGEIILVVLVQLLVLTMVTGAWRHPVLAALPFVSAATFGLFFSQLRGIAEHGAVGDCIEASNVRSHSSNWLDRIVLYDVNFNYHREHHERPEIPSCHLPAVQRAVAMCDSNLSSSMFRTLIAIGQSMRHSRV